MNANDLPRSNTLHHNYPNPFNPKTKINYDLPITNYVNLSIYNLLGQKIATLVDEQKIAGFHQVEWDASGMASGIYYYRIAVVDPASPAETGGDGRRQTGKIQAMKKMVLTK
jgi:hypothetical protein